MTSQVQENDLEQFCESFSKKNSIIWENDQKQNSISANEKQMKFAFPAYEYPNHMILNFLRGGKMMCQKASVCFC